MVDMTSREYDEKISMETRKAQHRLKEATRRLYYDRGNLTKIFFYSGWNRRLRKCLYAKVGV
ncbi:MAG: hypothetical protein RBR23_01515 [Arcobacteraceae bacterium]|jgi:hypothetical protein|nr:hypothetical protein [Arcobacteraceae bacterium]